MDIFELKEAKEINSVKCTHAQFIRVDSELEVVVNYGYYETNDDKEVIFTVHYDSAICKIIDIVDFKLPEENQLGE